MRVSASTFHYKRKRVRFCRSKTKEVKTSKPLFSFSASDFQQNCLVAKDQQHQTRQKFAVLESISMYLLVEILTL